MSSGKRDQTDHPTDLVTDEGVDEGSAASATEGASTGAHDPQGSAPHGRPAQEADPAGPLETTSPDIERARAAAPGQELAEGEGAST